MQYEAKNVIQTSQLHKSNSKNHAMDLGARRYQQQVKQLVLSCSTHERDNQS